MSRSVGLCVCGPWRFRTPISHYRTPDFFRRLEISSKDASAGPICRTTNQAADPLPPSQPARIICLGHADHFPSGFLGRHRQNSIEYHGGGGVGMRLCARELGSGLLGCGCVATHPRRRKRAGSRFALVRMRGDSSACAQESGAEACADAYACGPVRVGARGRGRGLRLCGCVGTCPRPCATDTAACRRRQRPGRRTQSFSAHQPHKAI